MFPGARPPEQKPLPTSFSPLSFPSANCCAFIPPFILLLLLRPSNFVFLLAETFGMGGVEEEGKNSNLEGGSREEGRKEGR